MGTVTESEVSQFNHSLAGETIFPLLAVQSVFTDLLFSEADLLHEQGE